MMVILLKFVECYHRRD